VLLGPTAVGKSRLALDLAEELGAELLSLDSMQVYRGMDVGTAKPSHAERARVRHHLLDLVAPSERYDVSRYVADAAAAEADVRGRGRTPLFVGGTGLYLRALVRGLFDGPPVDPALRARLNARCEREGSAALHAELARFDPALAARLHPNDQKRIVRGHEVFEQTARALSDWQRQWGNVLGARPLRAVGLQLPDDVHQARISERIAAMLDSGWVEEARRVRAHPGFGPTAIQALGYREVLELADARRSRAECAERIALLTRQFARRQRTWFRYFAVRWLDPRNEAAHAEARAVFESGVSASGS